MEQTAGKNNAPRKMRFAPKAPTRRAPKLEVKAEVEEDIDAAQAMDLLQRFNQSSVRTKPKVEKKVSASQVAFGHGAGSGLLRTFGASKGVSRSAGETSTGGVQTQGLRGAKEYKEPWDYYSYYPLTLPMRRPYSGNPEFLDEVEFVSDNAIYNEDLMEPAVELGLMEENLEPTMLFLKLPPTLPTIQQPEGVAREEARSSSRSSRTAKKTSGLAELPAGLMGKMLVYKSGAVKLKLGDTIYDVNTGMNCVFAQDVVAVNPAEKQCCAVGEIDKHAVVTPDVDSVLSSLMSYL
ncbi:lichenase-like [Hibiscus syriacus]|uniref:Lichenase-like n=1 Tax=Hibiscus syriacus TaxID=106335 RepID=A0A6A2YJ03_HIBSY|nr:DNA-directed RNA polymerase III subunit rpc4-like [Hibiscus syriacus]KAE8678739.1 lichenase-like [Hibiscus syriacus]